MGGRESKGRPDAVRSHVAFPWPLVIGSLMVAAQPADLSSQIVLSDSIPSFQRGDFTMLARLAVSGCSDAETWDDSVMRRLLEIEPSQLTALADRQLTLAATVASGDCDWSPAREFLTDRMDPLTLRERPWAARIAARQLGREGASESIVVLGVLEASVPDQARSSVADVYTTGLRPGAREDFFFRIATDQRAPVSFVTSQLSAMIAGAGADSFIQRVLRELPSSAAPGTAPAIMLEAIAADAAFAAGVQGRMSIETAGLVADYIESAESEHGQAVRQKYLTRIRERVRAGGGDHY